MIKVEKINHHGENRLKLDFPYDAKVTQQVRQITGSAWSRTFGAWLLPYTNAAVEELKKRFPDIKFPEKKETTPGSSTAMPQEIAPPIMQIERKTPSPLASRPDGIEIEISSKHIDLSQPSPGKAFPCRVHSTRLLKHFNLPQSGQSLQPTFQSCRPGPDAMCRKPKPAWGTGRGCWHFAYMGTNPGISSPYPHDRSGRRTFT